jgi:hypothetical protein
MVRAMNNIPENINRDHIIKAIEAIDKNRYPLKGNQLVII